MHNAKLNRLVQIATVILALVLVGLRFVRLEADPDTSLSLSRVFYTDEGYNSCNAVNEIVTGHWLCDRNNHILLMPWMPVVQYLAFRTLGLSLAVARLPATVLSVLIMALLLVAVRRRLDEEQVSSPRKWTALALALFLLGTNYYFYVYGRLALLDLPMTAFGLASLLVFHRALALPRGAKVWWYFAGAGALLGLAFLTKPSAALYATVLLVFVLLQFLVEPASWCKYVFGLMGAFLVSAILVGGARIVLAAAAAGYQKLTPSHLVTERIVVHLYTILRNYEKFFNNPVVRSNWGLLLLAYINVVVIAFQAARAGIFRSVDRLMIAYLVACYLFLGFFVHQHPRYFVVLVVPVMYLVATLPGNLRQVFSRGTGARVEALGIALVLLANSWNVVRLVNYHRAPACSLRTVAQEVREVVMADSTGRGTQPVLCGDLAATLALANGMRFSFDLHPGVQGQYLFAQGEVAVPGYRLRRLATFDLLGNYYCYDYGRRRMLLYRVEQ